MATQRPDDDPLIPQPGTRLSGRALGLDVGGTGVKGAVVDLATGSLVSERIREKTPQPATPDAVMNVVRSVVDKLEATGTFVPDMATGCGLPGVVKHGRLMTAANIDQGWLTIPAEQLLTERLGRPALIINDADAAGLAELAYGAAAGHGGTVLLLTLGTGIGSALFIDGHLVPNTELGHLELKGKDAETRVSGMARERRRLSWKEWAREFNEYLARIEAYLWPDLIILGGGVSKELGKYEKYLSSKAPVVAAQLLNAAGIAGAALAGANAQRGRQGQQAGSGDRAMPQGPEPLGSRDGQSSPMPTQLAPSA